MTKFTGKVVMVTGADGVKLAQQLGADEVVNGRDDVAQRARAFAPDGFDTARVLVGGDVQSMLSFRDISEFFLL